MWPAARWTFLEQGNVRVDVAAQTERGDRLGGLLTPGCPLTVRRLAAMQLATAVAGVVGSHLVERGVTCGDF
jgi:hypothetical protein